MVYPADSQSRGAKVPCWPNPSRVTIFFTRDVNRFIYLFASTRTPFLFLFLFLFSHQIDHVLSIFGYKADFVSYFPFLRALHARLISSVKIGDVSTVYFHVLDVCVWMCLAVWGTRLTAGLFFLRQYDDFYQGVSLRLAHTPREQVYAGILGGIIASVAPFGVTYLLMQPKILNDPEIVFVVVWLPAAYFISLAVTYFYCTGCLVELSLFLLWKVLRQKRRGVVL
jgi:hypothetical protein